MNKSFFIHTTGCKVNQWDTSVIAENLDQNGFMPTTILRAGVVVINACTVTDGAVRDTRRFINRVRRENPTAKIVIAGCHGQVYPEENFGADLVLGQAEKYMIKSFIDQEGVFAASPNTDNVIENMPRQHSAEERTRFFFKIQDGCDRFCSYCIVPYARGLPRSRPIGQIVDMMGELAGRGVKEVVLTGIEISAYLDPESGMRLGELLGVLEDVRTPGRIRLSSVDPLMFDDTFIEVIARSRKIARSFHIPLQSASDDILAAMGRPYRRQDVAKLLEKITEKMDTAGIGMDVIAGFPGEDDRSFRETYSFLKSQNIYYLHIFPFSPRPGTGAALMDGRVSENIKKQRVGLLKELDGEKRGAFHMRFTGKEAQIIPEGKRYHEKYMRGYTENYIPVHIPYDKELENSVVRVRIKGVEEGLVIGEPVPQINVR